MFVQKNISFKGIMAFSGGHLVWLTVWMASVASLHYFTHLHWIHVPTIVISVIGTAVAFYIGFKNNQAYDRLWEARKIWGAIVNDSRAWAAGVRGFVGNDFTKEDLSEAELKETQKRLIYRHIGWLYTLRSQLLIPTSWEHINQNRHIAKITEKRRQRFGVGLHEDNVTIRELGEYLPKDEHDKLINMKNTATQIIDHQAQDLKRLRTAGQIDDFRHMELQGILSLFYTHQGKAERIKKFPLPRQYGGMSFIFVAIFIFIMPFGIIPEFEKFGTWGVWASIPFTVLLGWVYLIMELVGDYSENPFEGLGNDIPMLALCRTIEIDLLEMIGETDLPEPIKPINGVLM